MSDEIRDELPEDLNASEYVGPYQFPDNSRRRIPAFIYLALALLAFAAWLVYGRDQAGNAGYVNVGFLWTAILLAAFALFLLASSWKLGVNESEALVLASKAVDFAVGHASAQQVWRGWRSRPTWRVFCYSAEEPPTKRGLVLIDAIDGSQVECLVEDNPEV
jgi:hypothetical protein